MKSFTSSFLLKKKVPKIYANVGVMLGKTKFMADFVAYDIVALFLDIFTYVLAFQAEGIETAVADFPFGKSLLLKMSYEFRMTLFEDGSSRDNESFSVCHKLLDFLF